jgi:hypothetical protein
MSISLGQAPRPDNDGAFEEARRRIANACTAAGVVPGIHANAALAARHVAAGYRMITVTNDAAALGLAAAADSRAVRGAPPGEGTSSRVY